MPGASPLISRLLAILLGVACLGFLVNLGAATIWDANEAYYVETPREMIESGDYVLPTFNYELRVNKPVLSYWVVAAFYHVFGVSVGVQRLPIAAAALVMIAAVFLLARAASSLPLTPWLAAAGLAANPRFFMFARRILIDMGVTMCMTLTLTCFAMSEVDPARRRRWLLAMYVSVGLGVLTKGPVAAALPALAFLAYLAVYREWRRVAQMMLPQGAIIILAIVAPWYVAMYVRSGWTHIVSFIIGENFERLTTQIGPQARDVWFYLPVVFSDGLPWSLCLPGAIALWIRDRRQQPPVPQQRIRTLLVLWTAVIVGLFSLSQTKQDLYVFPIVGAVTVLGADLVARTLAGLVRPVWLTTTLAAVATGLALAGAGILFLFARTEAIYSLDGARPAGILFVVGGLAMAALVLMRRQAAAVLVALAVPIAFCWILSLQILPSFERYKPVAPLSALVLEHERPGDELAHYDVALPSMVYYVRRRIDVLFERDAFLRKMRSEPVLAVLPESRYEELRDQFGVATCILGRHATFEFKIREVLAGSPPPSVLLVSTRCP